MNTNYFTEQNTDYRFNSETLKKMNDELKSMNLPDDDNIVKHHAEKIIDKTNFDN